MPEPLQALNENIKQMMMSFCLSRFLKNFRYINLQDNEITFVNEIAHNPKHEKKMRRFKLLLLINLSLLIASCASQTENRYFKESDMMKGKPAPFNLRISQGDQHIGWALTYFESWKQAKQPRYLKLAYNHATSAIEEFARLQSQTSPRIGEFYIVRQRRIRGCRFWTEIQRESQNVGYHLPSAEPWGCLF